MAFNKYLLFTLVVIAANTLGNLCFELDPKIAQDLINIYTHKTVQPSETTFYSKVDPDDVQLYLYTADNPQQYIRIDKNHPPAQLKGPEKIVFVVHGWLESRNVQWYEDLKNEFLSSEQDHYKVILVDWQKPALKLYSHSAANTRDVGAILGDFIVNLKRTMDIPIEQFIVVGHSLGGQVAGFTGKNVYRLLGETLPRIVALDPAGPLFSGNPEDQRLCPIDAKIVHVIHTDGGTFGMKNPCGTIDFFPNGGSSQPGCITIDVGDPTSIPLIVPCSHQRSWMYFIEAISNPSGFKGRRCENWMEYKIGRCEKVEATMGDMKSTVRGKFYLETNRKSPYSKTKEGFGIVGNLIPVGTM